MNDATNIDYKDSLMKVDGLQTLIEDYHGKESYEMKMFLMEFALHGLAEYSMLSKNILSRGLQFKDLLSSMFNPSNFSFEDDEDEEDDY